MKNNQTCYYSGSDRAELCSAVLAVELATASLMPIDYQAPHEEDGQFRDDAEIFGCCGGGIWSSSQPPVIECYSIPSVGLVDDRIAYLASKHKGGVRVLHEIQKFLQMIPQECASMEVDVDHEGHVMFEWYYARTRQCSVTFSEIGCHVIQRLHEKRLAKTFSWQDSEQVLRVVRDVVNA